MNRCLIAFILLPIFVSFQSETLAKPPLQIINGTAAAEGEFPYMVQLRNESNDFWCGGSILAAEWVLTAGHCVSDRLILSVIYGTNRVYDREDGANPNNSVAVKNWFLHPGFAYVFHSIIYPIYDVAILQLAEPIPFSDKVQPIQLAEANEELPFHEEGVLSGWGYTVTEAYSRPNLQKVNLQLLTDEECTNKFDEYAEKNIFNRTVNICTDAYFTGPCDGDSGSPYVINGTQYGITSWGVRPYGIAPASYTRIVNPDYRDWIRSITNI